MEKTDVLVIGGSAAGIIAAVTGKSYYPDKDFLLIRKEKKVLVPCGIPYIFGSLGSSDKDIVPDAVLTDAGIKLMIDEVISIDKKNKKCKTSDGTEISFEKLVLAIGSIPIVPKWLRGANLENVFTIPKDKEYLDEIIAKIDGYKRIVTIGGGFIGVEIADELNKIGKNVTIVEILPHVLCLTCDEEITITAEEILKSRGVKIRTGVGAKEILGDKKATGVLLNNGEKLETDAVILSLGYRPNTGLAEKSGIKINEMGFIKTDEFMRTDNLDFFAVGDCAEKKDFVTRKSSGVMLASTACAEARIAGMNLYKLCSLKIFNGTIAIFCTAIGETGFGAAGLTENIAKKEGFDVVTGIFKGVDKHPGTLSNTHKQIVKLIVARESGMILGGEVVGGPSVGELTNLFGLAIQNKMTINSILTAQIGTHPLLTAPPTAYPLLKAAEVVAKKIKTA
jgi:pyruvate/2-oxoglutarate dehydrogenase complex dihydrolipoamide dehydrogenase (E3) component